jgi:hypothetical protein
VVGGEPAVSSVGDVVGGSTRVTRLGGDGGVSGIVGDLPLGRNCLTLRHSPDPGWIRHSISYSLHRGLGYARCAAVGGRLRSSEASNDSNISGGNPR